MVRANDVVMVLSWLLKNSGLFGDMLDSDHEIGLYVSAVDLVALGLTLANSAAAAGGDH